MKKAILMATLLMLLSGRPDLYGAAPRFEKLSDHCYFLQVQGQGSNVGAVITNEGVLLVNPPAQPDFASTLAALKRLTSKPVRWIVGTDYEAARSGILSYFVDQGAVLLVTDRFQELAATIVVDASKNGETVRPGTKDAKVTEPRGNLEVLPRFIMAGQMRLFPAAVEIRILALQHKAHTAADIVVFVPGEKVLFVGDLFSPGSYPDIDAAAGDGNALGWLDGMKQVIDMVPLLKAAKPQPKVETKPKANAKPIEEKTLEELVTVVTSHGPQSNLQEMKDLWDMSHKLRNEIARVAPSGRDANWYLNSSFAVPFRAYANLETYVNMLFDALIKR